MSADVDPPSGPPPEDGRARTRQAASMIQFQDDSDAPPDRKKRAQTTMHAPSVMTEFQAEQASRRVAPRGSMMMLQSPDSPGGGAEKRHTVARRTIAPNATGSIIVDDLDFAKLDRMSTPTIVLLASAFVETKAFERFMMFIVMCYGLLAIGLLIVDDIIFQDTTNQSLFYLALVDVALLGIFVVEICLKTAAYGSAFILDTWVVFDTTVITAALGFAFFVLFNPNIDEMTSLAVVFIRAGLRLLRIVTVCRRVFEISERFAAFIDSSITTGQHSPADVLTEVLEGLVNNPRLKRPIRHEVMFAIRAIRSGKLYEVADADAADDVGDERTAAEATWFRTGMGATQYRGGAAQEVNVQKADFDLPSDRANGAPSQTVMRWIRKSNSNFMGENVGAFIGQWTVPMIELNKSWGGYVLPIVFTYITQISDLFELYISDKDLYETFMGYINKSYHDNSYHNSAHAADVMQTMFWILWKGEGARTMNLNTLEMFSAIFAGMIHDIDHPGRTNPYHVATRNPLAILYNDRSVLESHHVAFTYLLLERKECNIFSSLAAADKATMRDIVIQMVLSTDNTKHFHELGQLKARMQETGFPQKDKPADKILLLKNILHACDISNPTKDVQLAVDWTVQVLEEFFWQGDREKSHGIPVSMFMDRMTTNVGTCQVGFIDALVAPLYGSLELLLPNLRDAMNNLHKTRAFWACTVDTFAEHLKSGSPYPLDRIPSMLDEILAEGRLNEDGADATSPGTARANAGAGAQPKAGDSSVSPRKVGDSSAAPSDGAAPRPKGGQVAPAPD